MRFAVAAAMLSVAMTTVPLRAEILRFADLDGWATDDHRAALTSFRETCDLLEDADWVPLCRLAADAGDSAEGARQFFELFFRPVVIGEPPALFTGYYEPELAGSPVRTPRFAWPIYRRPPELQDGQVYLTRAQIEAGALRGRGLELAWLDDPVDVYFLQVQGSGRIRMPDGRVMRVGYAGRNGHAYRSVGQEMVRRGTHSMDQVSAQEIAAHVRNQAGAELLNINPSYVFFRTVSDVPAEKGPIGAMARSITAFRSVAIDPDYTPLGAPVWVEKDGAKPIRSLMVAQDTGGAIKGPQRADIFYGTGPAAGDAAGTVKDGGRMVVLLPIDRAYAMLPDGM
ncbi:murein transglycosylase A [Rhodobacter sp. HX-7-19]|uniref:peptidoglycan lytic exotransglycosylase n=1 Tax=Paragemmobacter kunshanensis TaxID=2583234 RepID=A0A6M1TYB7_9RHOB|nr:MltA domain-containing protein [Rhodobacter kunshanensis]NGQ91142.1 murein transglycosylase A [Rhodobacter kunshanensis]